MAAKLRILSIVAGSVVAGLFVKFLLTAAVGEARPCGTTATPRVQLVVEALDDASIIVDLSTHIAQQEQLIRDLPTASTGKLDFCAKVLDSQPDDALWRSKYPRTSFALVPTFVDAPDSIRVKTLVRHVVLNAADVPLDERTLGLLAQVVDFQRARLTPLYDNYRDARHSEMLTHVRAGVVPPITAKASDHEIAVSVQLLSRRPEVKALGLDEEGLARRLREVMPPAGSYVEVDGIPYAFASFPPLKASDAMFEDIKYFAAEFLWETVAIFVGCGCADEKRLFQELEVLERFGAHARRRHYR